MDEKNHNQVKESCLLTIIADIFEVIPPENPSVWAQKASCVPVSVSLDREKGLYRIMCVHESRVIVNSCITTDIQFIIRTGLFGTWYDSRNSTTYGIGFRKLSSLNDFSYAFTQAKKLSEDSRARLVEAAESGKNLPEDKNSSNDNYFSQSEETAGSQDDENEANNFYSQDDNDDLQTKSTGPPDDEQPDMKLKRNDYEVYTAEYTPEFVGNEVSALAKESAHLRMMLLDSTNELNEWQAQLDSEKQRNEVLLTENEDFIREMDDLCNKEEQLLQQANDWKKRYDQSEHLKEQATEDTVSQYERELEEASNSKRSYESLVAKQEVELEKLRTRIASYTRDIDRFKILNESSKMKAEDEYNKTKNIVGNAYEQWVDMRDVDARVTEGLQKLADIRGSLKKLVRRGAINWNVEEGPAS